MEIAHANSGDPRNDATNGGPSGGKGAPGDDFEDRVREVESAAPGVAPIVEAAIHTPGTAPTGTVLGQVDDPLDVVTDQRAAMARAVELRDDEHLPAEERSHWADVVERLAVARHEAKNALAERRRENLDEETWMDTGFQSQMLAREDDQDPEDRVARGAPSAPGEHSGRDEPAPWQDAAQRVGPETGAGTTPSSPRDTDQLTSGPGMAGGTGGAGSQNLPADTGVRPSTPPLAPDEDVEPPDIAHR